MKRKQFFVLVFLFFPLVGCAPFENVTADDLVSNEHLYKTFILDKTLEQIDISFNTHTFHCKILGVWTILRTDPSKARYTVFGMGLTESSAYLVIDFTEQADGRTKADAYTYYSTWHTGVDKVIEIIKNPSKCN